MKPLIGITSYYIKDRELGKDRDQGLIGQDMLLCTMDNIKCIEKSGGIPIPIPVFEDNDEYITEIIERLDGIYASGDGPCLLD
ncbi:gamma-glutamyl-gamma-aminobutyrate hydrolase family protein [Geosporobacter ferrireducens]|uniref:gamma-glutamyl-gamma-aminobutyrate hydrolase family protein n=1 Tax=Geosporobacter ferrireducens TaxID=1424294 RepID=UPI002355D473|nr:gamma-glutamyl-gamma-aminobutyrate hydrolase family protein [Geosporobacter ferrireducens]